MFFRRHIKPTQEMRNGKPYCPGCDGGCSCCSFARDNADDVHTMPTDREHESSSRCWCEPEVDFVAHNGNKVWLHKEMQ